MMSKKKIAYLRAESHKIKAIFQIGKNPITDNFIKSVDQALDSRELIKISLLKTSEYRVEDILEILSLLHFELILAVGKTICIYRKSKKNIYEI